MIKEYLTGASADGNHQPDQTLSLGNFRSSVEAHSISINITNPIRGVKINYANYIPTPQTLVSLSNDTLRYANGPPVTFVNGIESYIYAADGISFLRITPILPFDIDAISIISLLPMVNNVFAMNNISIADATSGKNYYRGTILRSEDAAVYNLTKTIGTLGTQRVSDVAHLAASGSGTITTSGSFADWPAVGWCKISNGEIVYYSSRTTTSLTVPAAGRARLGTSATVGSGTDTLNPISGLAIGLDTHGVQANGSAILIIANENTAPVAVTFGQSITFSMDANHQYGIWYWKEIPVGALQSPYQLNKIITTYQRR